jgi:DNA-binding protein YbaB
MKNILFVTILIGVAGGAAFELSARTTQTRTVYAIKEEADGVVFNFHEEVVNGVAKRQWFIDGQPATMAEYEQELLEAEISERRKERRAREQARIQEQEQKMAVVLQGHKKVVRLLVERSVEWLKKYENQDIAPYLTMATKEQISAIESAIEHARAVLGAPDDTIDWKEVQRIELALEPLPTQLKDLFYQSINDAIQRCDDTRVLKNLLELVAR